MSENIDTKIKGKKFRSTIHALETARKAVLASDDKLYEQAMHFYYVEISRKKAVNIGLEKANKAAEKEDWDMYRNWMEFVYSSMPVTWAATWQISNVSQAKFILQTLLDRRNEDMANEGSAANLLASRAQEYVAENGSPEERLAIMRGANPQLYEIVTSPLGITDDGFKVIDVEDCAKALGIPVDEYLEMLTDSDFLPEGAKINPIH